MRPDPLRQTMLLFHNACGSPGGDAFAPYKLPGGEWLQWRMRPLSATQASGLDLELRGSRRTISLRPGRVPAEFPMVGCFGPSIDAVTLRAALYILRDARIRREALRFYSPLFVTRMEVAARATASLLRVRLASAANCFSTRSTHRTQAARLLHPRPSPDNTLHID